MLRYVDLENVLFLDIETVPAVAHFNDLDDDWKHLWEEKSRFFRERDEISLEDSYDRAGIYSEFGKIVCISVGYLRQSRGDRKYRTTSFYGHDERVILADFANLLNTHFSERSHMLCGHNGKEFDFPFIARRMLVHGIKLPDLLDTAGKKPWEVTHIDTLELWKFGDYKHYTSLKLLTKLFGIPTPKDDIDGSQVASVYYNDGDVERISTYCKKDVLAVVQLVLKYRGEELIPADAVQEV
ncbi:MAG: 3'-5' exonuclease [Cryomorphaceae bacterium]|nr:3'-5' exonuclease [Cryomorphaceae bacterium]